MAKPTVGVMFGGKSGEHEVSWMSAKSIASTLKEAGYGVVLISIDKAGRWTVMENGLDSFDRLQKGGGSNVALLPQPRTVGADNANVAAAALNGVDVFLPALHGTYGEDGSLQGLLELADVPYVGAGVLASSVGMDKDIHKRLFREAGIPVLDFVTVLRRDLERDPESVVRYIETNIGYPCFVKPCNLGSSVGVNKAGDTSGLLSGLQEAALYDRRIIIEQSAQDFYEIECSVLGNDVPVASAPGEIIPAREFYDYKAKYIDERSQTRVPADLPEEVSDRIRQMAIDCFKCIDCAGLARVDFFVLKKDYSVFVNEINTLPGFTPISMYPKMWQASGVSYSELLGRLISLALERYEDKNRRSTDYLVKDGADG